MCIAEYFTMAFFFPCFVVFGSIHLLVEHIKQLVEHILAEQVSCLCCLILGHGGEE